MAGGQIISQPVLVMRVGVDKSGPKQKGVYVKSKDPKVGGVGVAVLKEKQRWRDMLWYTDVFFFSFCNLLTLLVDGTALVRGVRIVGRVPHLPVALIDHSTTRGTILTRHLAVCRLVSNRRKLRTDTTAVSRGLSLRRIGRARGIDLASLSLSSDTLTVLSGLALSLLLLLPGLPFLANLLEF